MIGNIICSSPTFSLKKEAMKRAQLSLWGEIASGLQFRAVEEEGYGRGFQCIAGLDEVGIGPLAGPVVAAAVVLPRGFLDAAIKDSKLLTAGQRASLAVAIKEKALTWGVGVVEVEDIDRLNILKASLLAMASALQKLRPAPDYLLIDGKHEIPLEFIASKKPVAASMPFQRTMIKGDRYCLSIAAASIIAKVTRDEIMLGFDKLYPDYGFGRHKGYGSRDHLDALRRLGPSPIHRKSFGPVREMCGGEERVRIGPLFTKE